MNPAPRPILRFVAVSLLLGSLPAVAAAQVFQQGKHLPLGSSADAQCGASVSISGTVMAAGAPTESTLFANSGAVEIFERSAGGAYAHSVRLKAADAGSSDSFGTAVSLDGSRVAVGAPNDDDLANNAGSVALAAVWGDRHKIFGMGTPGCNGVQIVTANLPPEIDQPGFVLECTNVPPNSLGLGFVGNAQDVNGSDPFGLGVVLYIDFFLSTELIPLDFVSGPTGGGVVPAPIPNNPLIVGTVYYAQAVWAWSTCSLPPLQLSSSAGLQLVIMGI